MCCCYCNSKTRVGAAVAVVLLMLLMSKCTMVIAAGSCSLLLLIPIICYQMDTRLLMLVMISFSIVFCWSYNEISAVVAAGLLTFQSYGWPNVRLF